MSIDTAEHLAELIAAGTFASRFEDSPALHAARETTEYKKRRNRHGEFLAEEDLMGQFWGVSQLTERIVHMARAFERLARAYPDDDEPVRYGGHVDDGFWPEGISYGAAEAHIVTISRLDVSNPSPEFQVLAGVYGPKGSLRLRSVGLWYHEQQPAQTQLVLLLEAADTLPGSNTIVWVSFSVTGAIAVKRFVPQLTEVERYLSGIVTKDKVFSMVPEESAGRDYDQLIGFANALDELVRCLPQLTAFLNEVAIYAH